MKIVRSQLISSFSLKFMKFCKKKVTIGAKQREFYSKTYKKTWLANRPGPTVTLFKTLFFLHYPYPTMQWNLVRRKFPWLKGRAVKFLVPKFPVAKFSAVKFPAAKLPAAKSPATKFIAAKMSSGEISGGEICSMCKQILQKYPHFNLSKH